MPPTRETQLCRYLYDPLDRLTGCEPAAQANTQRFYLKDRLATEIQGAVQRSIMQHEDQLLAQQQRQNGAVESRLLATDQQRSVLNVLDATRPNPLAYTPYGHRPLGNGLLSLLGFNGERPDPMTGWYLLGNGYRAFNPVLMRFNRPDSWSPFGRGGINAYISFDGDPVNKIDPSGHLSFYAAAKFIINLNTWYKKTPNPLASMSEVPFRKIVRLLNGDDLTALALTSKGTHTKVVSNTKSMNLLHQNHNLTTADFLSEIREISLGHKPGYLPTQVIENKRYFKIAKNTIPANDTSPGREFLQDRYYEAIKEKKQIRIQRENRIIREQKKAKYRANYPEDWHSDTSYDSD